jgi:hypothetical protein
MKPILYEDDCAPDAREYFDIAMIKITGMNHSEFEKIAIVTEKNDGLTLSWRYGKFILEYSGDDPFYILYIEDDV